MRLEPRQAVFGFAVASLFGLFGVSCLSCGVIDSDRAQQHAVRRATLEENVRLALWRMESEVAPLVASESARPPMAYSQQFETARHVKLNFSITEGRVTSSQRAPELVAKIQERAGGFAPKLEAERKSLDAADVASTIALNEANPQYAGSGAYSAPVQSYKNQAEWGARSKLAQQVRVQNVAPTFEAPRPADVAMVPIYVPDVGIILAREVTVFGRRTIQGAWLDWDELREKMLGDIRDLLPAAQLTPDTGHVPSQRVLASLPIALEPGELPLGPIEVSDHVKGVLVVAWSGVSVAVFGFGLLLFGAISLSERRGDFVSAVTHELRTPLTTFRMYTEMLSEGMVTEEKRSKYVDTLRREAIRLSHLVENVLSYARIERGRARAEPELITVEALYDRFAERLQERATQVGMEVVLEVPAEAANLAMKVDTSAVEQVLFNLVDNACKYAVETEDKRVHLSARKAGPRVELVISDHGRGITGETRSALFTPFSKTAHEAANTAPGVGLGLALSRRLARAMKGELRYDDTYEGGARFLLSFPLCAAG